MSRSGTNCISRWDDAAIETLKARFLAGDSFAQIARAIGRGISRSACIGKAQRLGLERSRDPRALCRDTAAITNRLGLKAPAVARRPALNNGQNFGQVNAPAPPTRAGLRAVARFEAPDPAGVPLAEVTACHCRGPSGRAGSPDFRFCGRPRVRGQYCEAHAERAFTGRIPAEEMAIFERMAR